MANNKLYMQLIFLTALIATLGSLYFSEVRQYVPCEFCWYQRILMYPLVIISIIASSAMIRCEILHPRNERPRHTVCILPLCPAEGQLPWG